MIDLRKKLLLGITVTLLLLISIIVPVCAEELPSGQCGDNAYWKVTGTSLNWTFTIYGSGDLWDCEENNPYVVNDLGAYPLVIEEGITGLGDYSLSGSGWSWSTLTLPTTLTSIGKGVFSGCYIDTLVIGENVVSIDEEAFDKLSPANVYCGVIVPSTSFEVSSNNQYYCSENGHLFNKDKTTLLKYHFLNEDNAYEIPNTVTRIGADAFKVRDIYKEDGYGSSELVKPTLTLTIPSSVTEIGNGAFSHVAYSYEVAGAYSFDYSNGANFVFNVDSGNSNFKSNANGDLLSKDGKILYKLSNRNNATCVIDEGVETIKEFAGAGCNITGLTLPSSLKTIEKYAFTKNLLTDNSILEIPDSVTYIGEFAFADVELDEIHIGDKVETLPVYTFGYRGDWEGFDIDSVIDSISLGESVSDFSVDTFYNRHIVANGITISNQNQHLTQSSNIIYADNDTKIIYAYFTQLFNYVMPDTVVEIKPRVFANALINNITLSNNLTIIGENAFDMANINSMTLGDKIDSYEDLKALDLYVFDPDNKTLLTSINVSAGNTSFKVVDNNLYSYDGTVFYLHPYGLQSDSITIPDGVKIVKSYSYPAYPNLITNLEVNLPASIEEIEEYAFYYNGYNELSVVNIPANSHLEKIGKWAFAHAWGPVEHQYTITLPIDVIKEGYVYGGWFDEDDNVQTEINSGNYNKSLHVKWDEIKSGTCGDNLTWTITDGAKADTYRITISGTGDMYDYPYEGETDVPWKKFLDKIAEIVVEEGVTSIGENAFNGYVINQTHIYTTKLELPSTLTEIGDYAFEYMNFDLWSKNPDYKEFVLPNGLKSIGAYAFSNAFLMDMNIATKCYGERVCLVIPDNVETLGFQAFYKCERFTNLDVGDGVKDIGNCVFGYTRIESATFGKSLETLDAYAFGVNVEAQVYEYIVDEDNPNLKSVDEIIYSKDGKHLYRAPIKASQLSIADGTEFIDDYAFADSSITHIEIPSSVKSIGDRAFLSSKIKSVVIPDSVTYLGSNSFYGSDLETATVGDGVTSIGENAFFVSNLKRVFFGKNINNIEDAGIFTRPNNALQCIDVDPENPYYSTERGILLSKDGTIMIFAPFNSVSVLSIPQGVKLIKKGAGYGDYEEYVIPSSVERIEEGGLYCSNYQTWYAFDDHSHLEKIEEESLQPNTHLPISEKEGYIFGGWFDDVTNELITYSPEANGAYVKWLPISAIVYNGEEKIGEYATLHEAFAVCQEGYTIKICHDCEETEDTTIDKSITIKSDDGKWIDLGDTNLTITSDIVLNNVNFKINNSIYSEADVTADSCEFKRDLEDYKQENYPFSMVRFEKETLNSSFTNCKFNGDKGLLFGGLRYGNVVVDDCEFECSDYGIWQTNGGPEESSVTSTLTVKDTTINSGNDSIYVRGGGGNVIIDNCKLNSTNPISTVPPYTHYATVIVSYEGKLHDFNVQFVNGCEIEGILPVYLKIPNSNALIDDCEINGASKSVEFVGGNLKMSNSTVNSEDIGVYISLSSPDTSHITLDFDDNVINGTNYGIKEEKTAQMGVSLSSDISDCKVYSDVNSISGTEIGKILTNGNYRPDISEDYIAEGYAKYWDLTELSYGIKAKGTISELMVRDIPNQIYTGNPIEPTVVVEGLKLNEDYTVTYSDNVNVGVATATITGIYAYEGSSVIKHFNIVNASPDTVTITYWNDEDWYIQNVYKNTSTNLDKCKFVKEGCMFTGWSLIKGGEIVYSDEETVRISQDVNLYANWSEEQYCTVNFVLEGLSSIVIPSQTVEYGDKIVEPVPQYEGIVYNDWMKNGIKYDFDTPVTESFTLISNNWVAEFCYVSFDCGQGIDIPTQKLIKGMMVEEPYVPEVSGYSFKGWYDSNDNLYNFNSIVRYDFTLYGKWVADKRDGGSSSTVTNFDGDKDGNVYTYERAVVITKTVLPNSTYSKIINNDGNAWYNCNHTTDFNGAGLVYFQVPIDVIAIKNCSTANVILYNNGNEMPTKYLNTENGYAKFVSAIQSGGNISIDMISGIVASNTLIDENIGVKLVEEHAIVDEPMVTQESVVTHEKSLVTQKENPSSPLSIFGIIGGLGVGAYVLSRRKR